jgi:hypothetical protein
MDARTQPTSIELGNATMRASNLLTQLAHLIETDAEILRAATAEGYPKVCEQVTDKLSEYLRKYRAEMLRMARQEQARPPSKVDIIL